MHIQAHKPAEELFIPTKITFKQVEDIAIGNPVYPKPVKLAVPWSKVLLLVFEGKIDILVPIQVRESAKPGKHIIEGKLSFQGCTATICLPPKEQMLALALEIL